MFKNVKVVSLLSSLCVVPVMSVSIWFLQYYSSLITCIASLLSTLEWFDFFFVRECHIFSGHDIVCSFPPPPLAALT